MINRLELERVYFGRVLRTGQVPTFAWMHEDENASRRSCPLPGLPANAPS